MTRTGIKITLFRKMIVGFFRFYGDIIWGSTAKGVFRLGQREGDGFKMAAGAYSDLNCYFTHQIVFSEVFFTPVGHH